MIVPRVLSFDLDDTLWPVEPVIAQAEQVLLGWIRERYPRAAADHTIESMRALREDVAARHPEQGHDLTFLRKTALAQQFGAAGYGAGAADLAFDVFYAARNRVRFYPDVRASLARLANSYPLFALSNGNADLRLCGIADLFAGHVTARAVGAAKPDKRIFETLAERAGVEPGAVLHIGDDPRADVDGARRAGLQAVWINREERAWPHDLEPPARTIGSLLEIL